MSNIVSKRYYDKKNFIKLLIEIKKNIFEDINDFNTK